MKVQARQTASSTGRVARKPTVRVSAQLSGQPRGAMPRTAKDTSTAASSSDTLVLTVNSNVWWHPLVAGVVTTLLPAQPAEGELDM